MRLPAAPPFRRRALLKAMSLAPALGSAPALHAASAIEPGQATAFDLGAVRLLPGPFEAARMRDARYMLSLDADRLLHNFRVNAGLPPKAPVYGGWEPEEPWVDIRCHGHTPGHHLSACALMAASGGEPEFRRRVDYIVAELQACQQAAGSGLALCRPRRRRAAAQRPGRPARDGRALVHAAQGDGRPARRPAAPGPCARAGGAAPAAEFELVPFHRIAGERYNLYWQT